MKPPRLSHYQQLSKATIQVLGFTLLFFALTVGAALMGWTQGVTSLMGATKSLGYLLAAFVVLYVIASLVRWILQHRERFGRDGR